MSDRSTEDQIARLEACVASDPGASEFPALAEALRRAGRLAEAESVARRGLERKPGCLEGVVLLALTLLDLGRAEAARSTLSYCASQWSTENFHGGAPASAELIDAADDFGDEVSEVELESAFDHAEPVLDEIIDADRVAEEAMRNAALDEPEDLAEIANDPIFATRTMAELLERQGDADGASRIRASIEAREGNSRATPSEMPGDPDHRTRTIATLESWLANLRSMQR